MAIPLSGFLCRALIQNRFTSKIMEKVALRIAENVGAVAINYGVNYFAVPTDQRGNFSSEALVAGLQHVQGVAVGYAFHHVQAKASKLLTTPPPPTTPPSTDASIVKPGTVPNPFTTQPLGSGTFPQSPFESFSPRRTGNRSLFDPHANSHLPQNDIHYIACEPQAPSTNPNYIVQAKPPTHYVVARMHLNEHYTLYALRDIQQPQKVTIVQYQSKSISANRLDCDRNPMSLWIADGKNVLKPHHAFDSNTPLTRPAQNGGNFVTADHPSINIVGEDLSASWPDNGCEPTHRVLEEVNFTNGTLYWLETLEEEVVRRHLLPVFVKKGTLYNRLGEILLRRDQGNNLTTIESLRNLLEEIE